MKYPDHEAGTGDSESGESAVLELKLLNAKEFVATGSLLAVRWIMRLRVLACGRTVRISDV